MDEQPMEAQPLVLQPASSQQAREWAAVLAAAQIPWHARREDGAWVYRVPSTYADRAQAEIAAYEEDARTWPRPARPTPVPAVATSPSTIVVTLLLMVAFAVSGPFDAASPWFAAGAADSVAILAGDWVRTVTALCLHADLGHLLGNVLAVYLLGRITCRELGEGSTWLLVVLAGALGNFAAAATRWLPTTSVGASTAVFALVGLLGGVRVRENLAHGQWPFRGLALPLLAVVGLVAFLGVGGEQTDVEAHVWGAVFGVLTGLLAADLRRWRHRPAIQVLIFGLAAAIVAGAWRLALA